MSIDPREKRNVIPRWRPVAAIERRDLQSAGRFADSAPINSARDFEVHIKIWKDEADLAAASDIFDTFLLTGDSALLRQASRIFEANQLKLPPRLRQSVAAAHQREPDPLVVRRLIAFRETDDGYIRQSIRIIKKRLVEFPRDGLSYLELARLYTILGEFNAAERALGLARALAPEDRIVLRATLRFYDTVAELEEGWRLLRKSDRLNFDPWIQSAEVASATLLGKESRIADKRLVRLGPDGFVLRERTELAMALATLDRQSGTAERQIFKLVGQALPHSTENGFAQAVWLSDNSTRDFSHRFPDVHPSADALEAKVQLAVEQRDFETAVGHAEIWLEDQPFNLRAILQYLDLSSVHTRPTATAMRLAKRFSHVYAENWQVLNACVLVLVEGRDLESAKAALTKMEKEAPAGSERAFVEAAHGFVAFGEGNFPEGRRRYEKATQIAAEGKRNDLVVDSTIFWFRCEALNGLLSEQYIDQMNKLIDRAFKHVPRAQQSHLQLAWHSIRKFVSPSENNLDEVGAKRLYEVAATSLDDQLMLGT